MLVNLMMLNPFKNDNANCFYGHQIYVHAEAGLRFFMSRENTIFTPCYKSIEI